MRVKLAILPAILLGTVFVSNAIATPICIKDSSLSKDMNLPIYEWVEQHKPSKAIIVAVHSLTFYAASWNDFANYLAVKGYHVYALDQRGFGRWTLEGDKFAGDKKIDFETSQQDLLDLISTLRLRYPKQKVFLLGESIGANMSLLLASEHPELVDGAILAALSHKRRLNPRLCWAGDVVNQIVKPNAEISLAPYSLPYISSNLILTDNYARDPMVRHKMRIVDLIKVDHFNKKAIAHAKTLQPNFPLLIICGQKDGLFKSSELPTAVKQFGTHNVSLVILPNEGHLLLEYQIVNPKIAAIVTSWLQQQTPPPVNAAKPTKQVSKRTKQAEVAKKKRISSVLQF